MLCNHRGLTAASFGGVAGIFALFFFSDVPKVRKDIMQVGSYSITTASNSSERERVYMRVG